MTAIDGGGPTLAEMGLDSASLQVVRRANQPTWTTGHVKRSNGLRPPTPEPDAEADRVVIPDPQVDQLVDKDGELIAEAAEVGVSVTAGDVDAQNDAGAQPLVEDPKVPGGDISADGSVAAASDDEAPPAAVPPAGSPEGLDSLVSKAQAEVDEFQRRLDVVKSGGRLTPNEAYDADAHSAAEARLASFKNAEAISSDDEAPPAVDEQPPVETATADDKEAKFKEKPMHVQARAHRRNAERILRFAIEKGGIDDAGKAAAEKALESGDLRGILTSLKSIKVGEGESAAKIQARIDSTHAEISNHLVIRDETGNLYSYAELQAMQAIAINTDDEAQLVRTTELMTEGRLEISTNIPERKKLEKHIDTYGVKLVQAIQRLEAKGKNASELRALHGRLLGSRGMSVDIGAVVALGALKSIQTQDILVEDSVFENGKVLEQEGRYSVSNHLVDSGKFSPKEAEEIVGQIFNGDFREIAGNKKLAEAGLDKLFYGRKMSESEIQAEMEKMFDPKSKSKLKGLGLVALLALLASKAIFDDTYSGVAGSFKG